ncbi:glycosyltransferase [uncultured Stenotrophomonas sp.]|uniref:glycosyltransferase n=1 Tax=uncultured Stenotrophomonas sp. TaxID=165438 RepID=UPI0025F4ED88|nr:glycosyltransferase [uncultured Stenotrophomonas sp.]
MIDKKIHYCWFGGKPLPAMYERCVDSWNAWLPDFEIVRWDESNTAIDTPFLKSCYARKEWAFLSDYVRLRVVHSEGGIYLDADVEVIKNMEPLLDCEMFIGEESRGRATTGVFGAVKGHAFMRACMDFIDERHEAKRPYMIAPEVAMETLRTISKDGVRVLPPNYFYPYNPYDRESATKELMFQDITPDTFAIHHWGKSWRQNIFSRIIKKVEKKLWK